MVSVIIPTYKSSDTLKRAIDSVLNQDYENVEIIIVDDNDPSSVDREKTELLMKEFIDNKIVKYIQHEKNMNGAAARNTGFKYSKGEYICFLDDDDIFMPDKIRIQKDYMDAHPEFSASYTWRYDSSNKIVSCSMTGDLSKEMLKLQFLPTTITLMIRRNCYEDIGGFDPSFKRHQDIEFLLRFFEKYKIGVVEKPLSRIIGGHPNTLHGYKLEELKNQFLNRFDKKINEIDQFSQGFKKEVYSVHYANVVRDHMTHGHPYMALRLSLKCLIKYDVVFLKEVGIIARKSINNKRAKNNGR